MKQLITFGIVGSIGFIVDALVLLFLVHVEHWDIVYARINSFLIAVFITWILNRYFTFSTKTVQINKPKEYLYYLTIQSIGAGINFGIFMLLINFFSFLKSWLIIPLAIGSIVAMFFNFFMIKRNVYYVSETSHK